MKVADRIQQARQRFDALQPRERLLIIAVASLLVWASAQMLYFNPAGQQEKQLRASVDAARHEITLLEARETVLKAQLSDSGLAALKARVEELKRRRAELDEHLLRQGIKLLGPERMRELLHDLLQGSGLRLHALRRLPVERVSSSQKSSTAADPTSKPSPPPTEAPGVTLYRHTVQIELDGSYADMVRYLERLEASGWQLMWQSLDIETLEYPLARMRLTVYTLSLQEDWIGV